MAKFLSWQLPISKFSSLHVHVEVHTCTLPTFQVCNFTCAQCQMPKFASLHVHIVKFALAHCQVSNYAKWQMHIVGLQLYKCKLINPQVYMCTLPSAHCQMHKFTHAYCQNYMCTLPNAQWHTLKLFNGLIASPKVKTVEGKKVGAHSLARNTSGVEGRARVLGLGRLTSNSITHMDLHKPNNKLVNA